MKSADPIGVCSLTSEQRLALAALADGMIPADDRDAGAAAVEAGPRIAESIAAGVQALLYQEGLAAAESTAQALFARTVSQLTPPQIHQVLGRLKLQSPTFFQQLRGDVTTLYLSDPAVWQRIGFPGPSTESGGYPDFDQPQGIVSMPTIGQHPGAPTRTTLESICNLDQLEAALSEPTERVIEALSRLEGDLMILGVGGKMGPSLARMARRAFDATGHPGSVIGVARFTEPGSQQALEAHGVETIACDLLDPQQLDRLPRAANIVFMAGLKFGSTGCEPLVWAMNCYLPAMICRKFHPSRIVAFSTGNVYGLTPVHLPGPDETSPPNPLGEYAMSCLGRERMFEYFSDALGIPMALLRLNYASELRYGVLVDLAVKVWEDVPIALTMGYLNAIWQADANAMALCALDRVSSPPLVVNLAGAELISVRQVCEQFGRLLNKRPRFLGEEAPDALLSNGQQGHRLFGSPRWSVAEMLPAVAAWIQRGGERLGKPTHFETRDGRF